jgi:hypothetical protein
MSRYAHRSGQPLPPLACTCSNHAQANVLSCSKCPPNEATYTRLHYTAGCPASRQNLSYRLQRTRYVPDPRSGKHQPQPVPKRIPISNIAMLYGATNQVVPVRVKFQRLMKIQDGSRSIIKVCGKAQAGVHARSTGKARNVVPQQ